jgi:hypothetical protein
VIEASRLQSNESSEPPVEGLLKFCQNPLNDGSGLFTDESPRSGIVHMTTQSLTFGCFFMDYGLDGLLDIVAANGHVSDDIAVVQPTLRYA